jgi:hypothetical protein
MMYYGPGMGGWGMTFMIIANLVFWGLLIFVAVLVARYVRRGQDCFRPTRRGIATADRGAWSQLGAWTGDRRGLRIDAVWEAS